MYRNFGVSAFFKDWTAMQRTTYLYLPRLNFSIVFSHGNDGTDSGKDGMISSSPSAAIIIIFITIITTKEEEETELVLPKEA